MPSDLPCPYLLRLGDNSADLDLEPDGDLDALSGDLQLPRGSTSSSYLDFLQHIGQNSPLLT